MNPDDPIIHLVLIVGSTGTFWYTAFLTLNGNCSLSLLREEECSIEILYSSPDTCRVLYRVWTYGGYAGDLSPKSTLELLTSREKPVLVDVRPEVRRRS